MIEPLFWLALSLILVATSLIAVLVAAMPALQELARAARSAEKLFDTLSRELPPTLDAIRMTNLEINDLADDVSEGVKSADRIIRQVDRSIDGARKQAQTVQISTLSFFVGVKTAFKSFTRYRSPRRMTERMPPSSLHMLKLRERERETIRQDNRETDETYRIKDNYKDVSR